MCNPGTRKFKEGLATTQNKLLYHLLMFASQKIVLESQKLDFLKNNIPTATLKWFKDL